MATNKDKSGKNDVINMTKESYKRKTFKTAPGGIYAIRITRKSKIRSGPKGNYMELHIVITKGEHKKVTLFDNVSPKVDWKVAQLLAALGIKKFTLTLAQLLKLVTDKELRASLRETKFNDRPKNEVIQFLPAKAADDEDAPSDDDDDEPSDDDEPADDEPTDDDEPADDDDEPADDDEPSDDDESSDDDEPADDDDEPAADDDDEPSDDDDDEEDAKAKAKKEKLAKLKKDKAKAEKLAKAKKDKARAAKRGK